MCDWLFLYTLSSPVWVATHASLRVSGLILYHCVLIGESLCAVLTEVCLSLHVHTHTHTLEKDVCVLTYTGHVTVSHTRAHVCL